MPMLLPRDQDFLRRCLMVTALALGALIVVWFAVTAASALLLIFMAILFAVGLDGLARLVLSATGLSRHVSVMIAATAVAVGLVAVLILGGLDMAARAPQLQQQVAQSLDNISHRLNNNQLTQGLIGGPESRGDNGSTTRGPPRPGERITGELSSVASVTVSTLADILVVMIIGLYLALQPHGYANTLIRLFPPENQRKVVEIGRAVGRALRRWLVGRGVSMLLVGVTSTLGLWLIGIPFPILLGVLAGLLTFIPYLGPIISAVPAMLVAGLHGWDAVVYVGALYLALHIVEGYMLMPLVQHHAVSIAPGFLLIAQTLGGTVAGIMGIMLATPIALSLAIIIQISYVRDVMQHEPHLPGQNPAPGKT